MSQRRLHLVYSSLADASEDVSRALAGGYELAGNWSFAQILQHLNLTMQMTFERPDFSANFLMRPVFKLFLLPIMRRGKPLSMKAKSPPVLLPADDLNEAECADEFHQLVGKLSDPTSQFQPFHPMLGNINRQQWLTMQKWHCAHHLSFVVPSGSA